MLFGLLAFVVSWVTLMALALLVRSAWRGLRKLAAPRRPAPAPGLLPGATLPDLGPLPEAAEVEAAFERAVAAAVPDSHRYWSWEVGEDECADLMPVTVEHERLMRVRPTGWPHLLFAAALDDSIRVRRAAFERGTAVPREAGAATSEPARIHELALLASSVIQDGSIPWLARGELDSARRHLHDCYELLTESPSIDRHAHSFGRHLTLSARLVTRNFAQVLVFPEEVGKVPVTPRLRPLAEEVATMLDEARSSLESLGERIRRAIADTRPGGRPRVRLVIPLRPSNAGEVVRLLGELGWHEDISRPRSWDPVFPVESSQDYS
jgi:hypothetical protein